MPDRTIDQLEIQGPVQFRRPLTASAKIQTALDVSQECSHIYNPPANNWLSYRSAQRACHRTPKGHFAGSSASPILSTKQRLFHGPLRKQVQAATVMLSKPSDMLVSRLAKPILCSAHSMKARCRSPSSCMDI